MHFRFFAPDLENVPVISVDGVAPRGPNFSHWPGHRTPPALRHDLSTGIALRVAGLPPAERARLFEGLDLVVNTHYDTDGVLAAFALLHPETALAHRDLLLDAAATGDFQVFTSPEALAIDLTLTELPHAEPGLALSDLEEHDRRTRHYEAAFALVPHLLREPFAKRAWFDAEFREVVADVEFARAGGAALEDRVDLELAVLTLGRPLHRVAVNTAAGPSARVLAIVPEGSGHLYRYHDRVESWFDLATRRVARRTDLRGLAARLDALEASPVEARWRAQGPESPVPECWFGEDGDGRSFGGQSPGALCVSRLPPRLVRHAVSDHLRAGATRPKAPRD